MHRKPQNASGTNPRIVDLSGAQLTVTSAAILSDVFTIEWGLRKLVFRECDLDDQVRIDIPC
jgi:protein phosphatase 1 regulatory subunit 37